jgi:hypothetical protein
MKHLTWLLVVGVVLSSNCAVAEAAAETRATPAAPGVETEADHLFNERQRLMLEWTERQFRGFFDRRTFAGWSAEELEKLEARSIDALSGPVTREYYEAINTLGALRSERALPKLREVAFERRDKNNRDRWMAIRVLGLIGDRPSVPSLVHLVYHGNINTRWWAQISLVRLTSQNFGGDWKAWGEWWNRQGTEPRYDPEIIRWWDGQPPPDELATSLAEGDNNFFAKLKKPVDK